MSLKKKKLKIWAFLPFGFLALFLTALGVINFKPKLERQGPSAIGQTLPNTKVGRLGDGEPFSIRGAAGETSGPYLVNFFASWCGPCIAENVELIGLKGAGFTIVGVAWKDEPKNTLGFLQKYQNPYVTTLMDPDGVLATEMGVSGVPETFVVSSDGVIIDKITGPILPRHIAGLKAHLRKESMLKN
jgi:cytochrome c biogenesis protein CcmG, thiol:disulfide interchange protein DsbE